MTSRMPEAPGRGHLTAGLVLLIVVLCAGCATRPPTLPPSWENHQQQMTRLDNWRLQGKLGYRSNTASGESGSAWIDWSQQGNSFDVHLTGPLGAGATHIQGDSNQAVLSQGNNQPPVWAPGPEELTQQLFGWALPVNQLVYWARGIPAPGMPAVNFSPQGSTTLIELAQAGWRLQFSHYSNDSGWLLPGKIVGDNGQFRFTLLIKQWQVLVSRTSDVRQLTPKE